MAHYAFILGRAWQACLAEITSYMRKEKIEFKIIDMTSQAVILDTSIKPENVIEQLGGTMKIVMLTKEFDFNELANQGFDYETTQPLSFYGKVELMVHVKKVFKNVPFDLTFKPKQILGRKKVLHENCLIFGLKTTYFGPTVAVADPFFFIKSDEKRPFQGDISFSRAMILANLSQAKADMLDYYTAMGNVGVAAAYLGVKRIFMLQESKAEYSKLRRNVEYFKKKLHLQANRMRMETTLMETPFTAAVAIMPQGPAEVKHWMPKRDAQKIQYYLHREQQKFFDKAFEFMKPGGLLVCAFPVYKTKQGKVYSKKVFRGFYMVNPFQEVPEEFKEYWNLRQKMALDDDGQKAFEYCVFQRR